MSDPDSLGAFQQMQLEAMAESLPEDRQKLLLEQSTTEDPRDYLFTPDARFLICATHKGAWIFEWQSLLASSEANPKPIYRVQSAGQMSDHPFAFMMSQMDFSAGVSAVAYDPDRM